MSFGPVHAQREGRRLDGDLRRGLDRQRIAPERHRAAGDRGAQGLRDGAGGNAAPRFRRDLRDRVEQLGNALWPRRRREAHGRVVQEREPIADLLDDLGPPDHSAGHEIPFVDDDDGGAARVVGVPGDVRVLRGDALGGVDDHQRHLAPFEALERHDDGELLERLQNSTLAPDPGGVDQHVGAPLVDEGRVDGVARRAGLRVDEHPLGADHRVHERRLADVRASHDRDVHRGLGPRRRHRAAPAQRSRSISRSSATPRPCSAETGSGSPKPRR